MVHCGILDRLIGWASFPIRALLNSEEARFGLSNLRDHCGREVSPFCVGQGTKETMKPLSGIDELSKRTATAGDLSTICATLEQ